MDLIGERIKKWQVIAKTYPDMRYPAYNIQLRSNLSSYGGDVTPSVSIYLETFVQNEGGTRIVLVSFDHRFTGQYSPDMLRIALEQFEIKCKLVKEKHIFNARHSVKEPFDFNK